MLNKEVCSKCWNARMISLNGTHIGWLSIDDEHWKKGWVTCPTEFVDKVSSGKRLIDQEPPDKCPYVLEHIVSDQDAK